jgi:excinuclease UvrABC nuclease subunit
MPFPEQRPIPFTSAGVQSLAAGYCGCYGIFRDGQWVYVGKATDLRARLMDHLRDPNILGQAPTHFVTALHMSPEALEKQLILECRPCVNQKVG